MSQYEQVKKLFDLDADDYTIVESDVKRLVVAAEMIDSNSDRSLTFTEFRAAFCQQQSDIKQLLMLYRINKDLRQRTMQNMRDLARSGGGDGVMKFNTEGIT